ncbi:hypothetical protein AB0383_48620 [Amycolatopsis sp. NPDC051373]|uniref:hypothetical protein n=1 Tax=Amycolatopsis sp. NPDC051373 TaxID=3155801 RepID=UPI00344F1BFC
MSEQLTAVRAGEASLNTAQAVILDALERLEFAQAEAARIRDAEVTAAGEGRVAANPRSTSAAAAAAIAPRIGTQRGTVLTAIVDAGGLTDVQIAKRCRISPNSARPRRLELVESGHVVDSGRTRKHGGRAHVVWVATPEGHAWDVRNSEPADDQAA